MENQSEASGPGNEYNGIELERDKILTVETLPVKVSIQEDHILKDYSKKMFGFNFDWLGIDKLKVAELYDIHKSPQISREYIQAMNGFPLPLCRMAGTDSQHLHWKQTLGPVKLRKKQKLAPWAKSSIQQAGLVEWINSCRKIDKDAQFVWVVNMFSDSPQDATDIAEFFMSGTNTYWGRKRIEHGLKHPVKPAIWELGNELDWGHEKISNNEYIKLCREVINAIKKIQPDTAFAVHAKTAPWSHASENTWKKWNQTILNHLADDIHYIVFHPYYHGHKTAYLEQFISRIESDINKSNNPNIKLFISEHAKWRPQCDDKPRKYWYQTHALTGCLDTAEWLLRMLNRTEVTAMTYHCHSSGPWGMIYRDENNDKLYTTGIADLFKLFNSLPGQKVLKCKVSGEYANVENNDLSFTAAAISESKEKLYLIFNNRLPNTNRKVTLKFQNQYYLKKVQTLSAPDLHSHNTVNDKVIKVKIENIENNINFLCYTIPPKSLVFLELKKK